MEKYHVILNATAFYPEGGGQPADKGMIDNIPVVDVQYIDGELCHIMESPLEARTGHRKDRLNWRFDLMQQHSGEHIVSGMIHEKYVWQKMFGFAMGEEIITIDLSGMLTWQQVQEIEKKVNYYIWMNQQVNIFYIRTNASRKFILSQCKELTGEIRLVEFPGANPALAVAYMSLTPVRLTR
ncbi:MAG: alanine--tRNA ligase-related protein [Anaerobutyricum sp.]